MRLQTMEEETCRQSGGRRVIVVIGIVYDLFYLVVFSCAQIAVGVGVCLQCIQFLSYLGYGQP